MKVKTNKGVVITIILIMVALVLAMVGVAIYDGWFDEKTTIDQDLFGATELKQITTEEYEQMIKDQKSFVVLTYLPGCQAKLLQFAKNFAEEKNMTYYYYSFADMKNSTMHEKVKYSPSAVIVSKGKIAAYLDSNSDQDVAKYNEYDAFKGWMEEKIKF